MSIRRWISRAAALAILAVSLGATDARAQELTGVERQKAVAELEDSRQRLIVIVAPLTEAQWRYKPGPDRWSIAEVMEHLAVSEEAILGVVTGPLMSSPADPSRRSEVAGKDEAVLKMIPDRSVKFQAPEMLRPTGRFAAPADATAAFEKGRAATIEFVRTTGDDLRDHFYEHPAMRLLDGYQWILLDAAHSRRHTAQIEEIIASPDFPKG